MSHSTALTTRQQQAILAASVAVEGDAITVLPYLRRLGWVEAVVDYMGRAREARELMDHVGDDAYAEWESGRGPYGGWQL